jgi:hypothetical protein
MPWFDVTLTRTVIRTLQQRATVEVEADSEAEAGKTAAKLGDDYRGGEVYWKDDMGDEDDDPQACEVEEVSRQLIGSTLEDLKHTLTQLALHLDSERLDAAKEILSDLREELGGDRDASSKRSSEAGEAGPEGPSILSVWDLL